MACRDTRRLARSRSNTGHAAHSYNERFNPPEEEPVPEPPRITIPRLNRNASPAPEAPSLGGYSARPTYARTSTYDSPSRSARDMSPAPRLSRVPTEPTAVLASRAGLRPVRQTNTFSDEYAEDYAGTNGHRRDRSPPSPASSGHGSVASRAASWSTSELGKKAPPPPPPSRAKKPPPPPPPMKRSALSASETSHY